MHVISSNLQRIGTGKLPLFLLWCLALGILVGFFFYFGRWQTGFFLADFKVYYQAAFGMRFGRDPYQPSLSALQVVSQNQAVLTGSYYIYPLPFALMLVPLTFLPLEIAGALWSGISIAAFILAIMLLVKLCHKDSFPVVTPLLVIGCSLIGIVHNELKLGQVDLILCFLLVSSYSCYTHKRNIIAGIPLALVVIIKPYLGLIFLFFLWKKAYRVVASFLVTVFLCFAATLIAAGLRINLEWVRVTRLLTSVPRVSQVAFVSLYSLLLRLFTTTLSARPWINLGTYPAIAGSLLLACIVTIVVLLSVRRDRVDQQTTILEFALWVAAALLIFPELEDIHVTPAIIVLVVILLSMSKKRIKRYFYLPVNIYPLIVFLYFVNPLLPRLQWAAGLTSIEGLSILETGAYFLGLLLLFICIYGLLHKFGQNKESHQ